MRLLAVRLARFGDIVLLLPALTWLKAQYPGSHLTFVTDDRWVPLAGMCPSVDAVIGVDRLGMRDGSRRAALSGIWQLGQRLRKGDFDLAVDCHGFRESSLMVWWSGAPRRLGLRRFDQSYLAFCFNLPPVNEDKSLHVSDMFVRLARGCVTPGSDVVPSVPALVVPEDACRWASDTVPSSPYAVLFVDAPVPERRWPIERFASLAHHISQRWKAPVIVVGGKDTLEGVQFADRVSTFSDLSIPRLTALVASARVLISNDTGPMHLGPTLGVPTLGIFSVGLPEHFRPRGSKDEFLRGSPIEAVSEKEVMGSFDRLWSH